MDHISVSSLDGLGLDRRKRSSQTGLHWSDAKLLEHAAVTGQLH